MLNEKLDELIQKYGIYDSIGGNIATNAFKSFFNSMGYFLGMMHLISALNGLLSQVEDNASVALWLEGRTRGRIWFWLLSAHNRKKIRYLIQEEQNGYSYYDRPVLASHEIIQHKIDVVVLTAWHSGRHAELLAKGFGGQIIDVNLLVMENRLVQYFSDKIQQHPYADIFVARYWREHVKGQEKRIWHQRLIAHYLHARDFLSAKEEIEEYGQAGYDDALRYAEFWKQVEALLSDVKANLRERKQRDVLIHWIDQEEKEDFFSMRWVGDPQNGIVFHNAYTTMVNTRAVMYSILTGIGVKDGRLIQRDALGLDDTVFSNYGGMGREFHVVSANMMTKLKSNIRFNCYQNYPANYAPSMIGLWHALDKLVSASNACVMLFHCMETHDPYPSGLVAPISHDYGLEQTEDCSEDAKKSRDYLDRELEWYHEFFPPNAVSIYMSDHGNEHDLTEVNVNMPFKVVGKGILGGEEVRLFSYKDMHKLLDGLLRPDGNLDRAFTDAAVVDVIDPYGSSFLSNHLRGTWKHFLYERREIGKEELKKYLQSTKVVTAEGEYYTINILGEETYYRDKECKVNLIDNPAYADRVAELREKAGKFYNPWKEKRQVAIDFYEYLGIRESDIVDQCH